MILREGLDLIHKFAHVPLRAALQDLLAERTEPKAGADGGGSCVPEPLQLGTLRSHTRPVVGRRGG